MILQQFDRKGENCIFVEHPVLIHQFFLLKNYIYVFLMLCKRNNYLVILLTRSRNKNNRI